MADIRAAIDSVPDDWVDALRSSMSMRVQAAPGSVYKLPDQLGDDEFREDWFRGLSFYNSYPPIFTQWNWVTLPDELINPIWLCAEFHVGLRLQWFEVGIHFVYNDNGISIVRDKQPKYAAVGGILLQWISLNLRDVKKAYAMGSLQLAGQFSSSISFPRSLTRGLRGTRLGFS